MDGLVEIEDMRVSTVSSEGSVMHVLIIVIAETLYTCARVTLTRGTREAAYAGSRFKILEGCREYAANPAVKPSPASEQTRCRCPDRGYWASGIHL